MCKISFIIPVYNTGKYLTKCIESICNQDIKDYEIIVINDGSTDDSLQVLQQYTGIKAITILSQPNKGVSSARNEGIKICKGEYIFFVDSDDYIEESSLTDIMNIINKDNPDLLRIYNNVIVDETKIRNKGKLNTLYDIKELYTNTNFCPALWGYIFKTEIIKSKNILFNEKLRYSEDSNFIFKYLYHIRNIRFCNTIVYNYIVRNNSAIHQNFTQSWAESNLIALIDVLQNGNIKRFIIDYYLRSYFSIIQKAKLILSHSAKTSFNNYFPQITKLAKNQISTLGKLSGKSYKLACIIYSIIFYYYRFKSKFLS